MKALVEEFKPQGCGLIVRTVGEGVERRALEVDVENLVSQWKRIQEKAAAAVAPSLVHEDVGLVIGLVRDILNDNVNLLPVSTTAEANALIGKIQAYESPAVSTYQDELLFLSEVLFPVDWEPLQAIILDGAEYSEFDLLPRVASGTNVTKLY